MTLVDLADPMPANDMRRVVFILRDDGVEAFQERFRIVFGETHKPWPVNGETMFLSGRTYELLNTVVGVKVDRRTRRAIAPWPGRRRARPTPAVFQFLAGLFVEDGAPPPNEGQLLELFERSGVSEQVNRLASFCGFVAEQPR